MGNVELRKSAGTSRWRRMAVAVWSRPRDPQVYARLEVDMGRAIEYSRSELERTGVRVSPVHLAIRSIALCFRKYPEANAIVRCNRVYARKRINVFCQVAIPGKVADLAGTVLRDVDTKRPVEIAEELKRAAQALRNGTDPLSRVQRSLDRTPSLLYRAVVRWLDFLQYTLNLRPTFLGIPQDPFGGAMVTAVGALGASEVFAPLVPMTRAPIVVAVGRVEDKPVVRGGRVVIRPMCVLGVTFDHRVMDGLLAGKLAKFVTGYMEDPQRHEGE